MAPPAPKGYVLVINVLDPFFAMPREFYDGREFLLNVQVDTDPNIRDIPHSSCLFSNFYENPQRVSDICQDLSSP